MAQFKRGASTFESGWMLLSRASLVPDELPLIPRKGEVSTMGAAMYLITTMVGAGVLAFPNAFARGGWIFTGGCLVLGASICMEIGLRLSDAASMVEEDIAERKQKGEQVSFLVPERYEDLAQVALGNGGALFARSMVNLFLLFMCAVYLILIGSSIVALIPSLELWMVLLSSTVIFAPLTLMDDMTTIAKLSSIGVVASMVYGVSIVFEGYRVGSQDPNTQGKWQLYPDEVFKGGIVLSVVFFGFMFQQVAPSIRAEMKEPTDFPRASAIALSVVFVVYAGCGAVGYYGYGSKAEGSVLDNMKNSDGTTTPAGMALALAVIANLVVTFPIVMNVVCRGAESALGLQYNIFVRLAILGMDVTLAIFVPYFIETIGIISALFGVVIAIFLPLVLYWKMMSKRGESASAFVIIKHSLCLAIGLVTMVVGTIDAVNAMIDAIMKSS